ncbi:MAG: lipoxygenase family protein [Solirubrobacteraceae bacterium]
MADAPGSGEDGQESFRIRRRGFLGAGVAAAGAALIPGADAATAGSRAARKQRVAAGPTSAPASSPSSASAIPQVPLRDTYPNLPAVPVDSEGALDTLSRLSIRLQQEVQAKQGLTQSLTIDGQTRTAYAFLFGGAAAATAADAEARRGLETSLREDPRGAPKTLSRRVGQRDSGAPAKPSSANPLSLDSPEQFAISWTNFPNVYETGQASLSTWASSLTDADSATKQFWPMIAEHGFGFNLIIPERVGRARARALRQQFGPAWNREVRAALAAGDLYVIDMSRFEALQAQQVNGAPRFTPSTITLLTRNRRTRSLTPVAILVSGYQGANRTLYRRATASNGAWLYALQAAKTSITVFGIWLGHVYHWHIVTAAMQMTMFNTLPTSHPVYQLLAPQSKFAIPFDDVLLGAWSTIAPPTSLTSASDFLTLANDYAAGRGYFDDDPETTLSALGLRRRDFTVNEPWDKYPVVQRLLEIWDLVANYVDAFVRRTYASDAAVAADSALQSWIAASASTDASTGGNIRGLPDMTSREAVQRVLTSLLYRISVHGISRLTSTSSPALTFMSNYPHCLQRSNIPRPRARIDTKELLSYLPRTDTISSAVTFYFTFTFSTPYEPYIPLGGVKSELFFPGGPTSVRNRALIELRNGLAAFMDDYQPDMNQRFQWPRNIET